jgi:hypothetical protein
MALARASVLYTRTFRRDAPCQCSGMVDVNAQQVDLRPVNSWMLKLDEVEVRDARFLELRHVMGCTNSTLVVRAQSPELAEVFVINAMAPFVLNSKLKPLMLRGRSLPPGVSVSGTSCAV